MTGPEMDEGDCFIVAARLAITEPDLTLVHGIPLGRGGAAEGRRYWHAWCERTSTFTHPEYGPFTIAHVIDRSNGHDIEMSRDAYYNVGRIERTWRYTPEQAERLMHEHQHFGPWVDVEDVA